MKPILGFLLIICLASCEGPMGPAGEQGPPSTPIEKIYVSRFNNEDGIPTWYKSDKGSWRIEDGRLILSGTGLGKQMWVRTRTNFTYDLDISVDTEWLGGIENFSYGIMFRNSSKGSYGFGINSIGAYVVGEWDEDWDTAPEQLIAWAWATEIINKKGKNNLRVVTSGSLMEFYINGTMVNSVTDETLTEGNIRLYVGNIQEVAFDNLVVKVIGMDEQPLWKPLSE